jgi:hypothetical protein
VFLLPTATDDLLGTEKWGAGPTGVILKQQGGWTYGVLANHIWFTLNSESTYDWNNSGAAEPGGRTALEGRQHADAVSGWWALFAEKPANGPEWGVRFSIVFLLLK